MKFELNLKLSALIKILKNNLRCDAFGKLKIIYRQTKMIDNNNDSISLNLKSYTEPSTYNLNDDFSD